MKKEVKGSILSHKWTAFVLVFILVFGTFSMPMKVYANPYSGGDGNCTYTAWRLAYENTGIQLPGWGNACTWYDSARNAGYTVSTVPREKAIAVWSGGPSGNGHVAYVSQVSGNQIYIHEGGYDGGYHEGWENAYGQTKYYSLNHLTMIGYIYLGNTSGDTDGPLYSDFHVGEFWDGGFTVMAKVTDPSGISSVRYAIWTENGGQDDIKWYNGVCTDGNDYYWYRVNFSDHKNEKGKYIIHMYAYDSVGNLTNPGIEYDFSPNEPGESEDVFQIEDGILVDYTGDGGDVVIPDGVTSIGGEVFSGCTSLTSIIIPEGVTTIGHDVFSGCTSLTSIIIPKSVINIGVYAFFGCTSLKSVTIPDSVTSIGVSAFFRCSGLTNITIPESVTLIADGTFSDCTSLKSIAIPDSVTTIGLWAFSGCTNLTSITIPESVTGIGHDAFSNTPWLENQRNQNSLVIINHILIDGKTVSGDVVIPDSVTSIGASAFSGCSSLTGITIPESVTRINGYAFMGCTSLASISIPESVTNIGACAFMGCRSLTNISMPESITRVMDYTFDGCSSLANITIPDSVNSIGNNAFSGCSSLTNITIPNGVANIGSNAFFQCSSLASITIPESVINIEGYAFARCADDLVIFVAPGSYAETYVKNSNIPYRYIEHTHSYQNQITTQPGCTTAGVRTYTCSGCGDSYTEEIVAIGHKYTKATTNATCTAKGVITYTCSVCKHSYKEEIAATGHKYTKTTTNPTCTAKGAVTYTCSVCKHSYKEETPAIGHKYTKTTTNPTCTVNGAVTCTCSVCKHSYIEKTLPATGHKYVTTTVGATMEKNGVITTSCEVCKEKKLTTIDAPRTVSLSKTENIYNGKQQKPGVTVKDVKGKTLRNGIDYTVSYQKDMKNVGIHVVTVYFKGNYSGQAEMFFTINPKGTSISKAKPVKKGFELKWKKQSSQTTGYEIAYSTSSKFSKKNTKTLAVKKSKTTSKIVSKLKAKKKYYVRIRTYKTVKVNGKSTKLYSAWSKVKTIKTK